MKKRLFKLCIVVLDLYLLAWGLAQFEIFAPASEGLLFCVAFGAYFMGAVPYGLLLTKLYGLQDLRSIGSGNIGATNALRTGRKSLAFLTLLCDALKATISVFAAQQWAPNDPMPLMLLAASLAVIGHLFPVWLDFKGGKGVASAAGALLMLSWPVGIIALVTWGASLAVTRISSVAALAALIVTPLVAYVLDEPPLLIFWTIGLAVLLAFKHKDNIIRLKQGRESKIDTSTSQDT